MKKLLEFIIKGLVEKPKQIKINEEQSETEINFSLTVAPEDMGKIIGKNGQIIRAIRALLRASSGAQGKRVNLNLAET